MHGPRIILGPVSRSPAVSYSILRTLPAVSSQFVITPTFSSVSASTYQSAITPSAANADASAVRISQRLRNPQHALTRRTTRSPQYLVFKEWGCALVLFPIPPTCLNSYRNINRSSLAPTRPTRFRIVTIAIENYHSQ